MLSKLAISVGRPVTGSIPAHADAHVEPGIAVNHIIATAPFENVAAITTKDNVATVEEIDAVVGCLDGVSEQCPQTRDEVEVGEHAAVGPCRSKSGGIGIITLQHVIMRRSRQALDEIEAGESRGTRAGYERLIEEAVCQVDGDAERIVLKGGPIEARGADITIAHADAADHDVVATLGVELIHLAAADVDIVAGDRVVAERIEVVARGAIGRAVLDPVVTLVAHVLFIGLGAEDEVVALAAERTCWHPRR